MTEDHYNDGVRDAQIKTLVQTVHELTADVNKLKMAVYMLYGAIALIQFLPEVADVWRSVN
jgi:hypothetical protein